MFSDAQKLAFVTQSPVLCAAHDRAGWVGLFARDGQINDPVGSRPHEGRQAIEKFYDTFIAPNQIAFDVEHDIVSGMSVMRDLTLTSTMATGLAIPVPMHLRYDLVQDNGTLKIHRLYAHWELPVLLLKQLGSVMGWITAMQLTPSLLRHQGFGGLMGFMRGLFGRGRAGRKAAEAFLAAASRGDPASAALLSQTDLRGVRWRKVLAAGDYVTVTVEAGTRRGVARFAFARSAREISGVELALAGP